MSSSDINGLYWDSHWPLSLKQLVDDTVAQRDSPNTSTVVPTVREWYSQPRLNTDTTTEVITVNFRLPLSLSEISFEALRVAVRIEVWYQDRFNNWRQLLDQNRTPITLTLGESAKGDWYKFHSLAYPVVAKAFRFHATRVADIAAGTDPYSIGIRNTLPRRNVYDRQAGVLPFEVEQDPVGNVVAKYIKDWDAGRAIDDQSLTFWRSAAQPDPAAVVSLYLDYRKPDGSPSMLDGIAIDPVYTGQTLNLYYSNDETVGNRRISPITLAPSVDTNTDWRVGRGRWDTSTSPAVSDYRFPLAVGPLVRQSAWIGMEWTPDFDPLDGPPTNPILFDVVPGSTADNQYWPTLFYDVGAGEITLLLTDGTHDKTYSAGLTFAPGKALRIIAGWSYETNTVLVSIRNQLGEELGRLEDIDPDLPDLITVDGAAGFTNFRGLFSSHIVKLEDVANGSAAQYQTNPGVYVAPDPVISDQSGSVSSSLDNAAYAVDWTLQTHGSGGSHDSWYGAKTWTPIWRDYLTYRGKLFFPQAISMRYLKLEFTNLCEEPYPVYDSGIKTSYNVFPAQVQQLATTKHPGLVGTYIGALVGIGELALGALGIGSVNWLNPASVNRAVDAIFGTTVQAVTVSTGSSIAFSELPTSATSSVIDTVRTEAANPYIYRRTSLDANTLAGVTLGQLAGEWLQSIAYTTVGIAGSILDSFTPVVRYIENPTGYPIQGQDWWIFPGGLWALPAAVINGLVGLTQVYLGRRDTTEVRMRFMTASVHRYDVKTITRDAAIAYFAGVREVRGLLTSYIDYQDPSAFSFGMYSSDQWTLSNVRQLDTGPITTDGKLYSLTNPAFDLGITSWEFTDAGWTWDSTEGRWHWGSLTVEADGTTRSARTTDPVDVTPGDSLDISCWVAFRNLVSADEAVAISLEAVGYLDGEVVATYPIHDVVPTGIDEDIDGGDFDDEPSESVDGGSFDPPSEAALVWERMTGSWTVPSGVDQMRVQLTVTADTAAGRIWFDTIGIADGDDVMATAYKDFFTTSSFSTVRCTFRDSGLVRSDAMWARADPNNTNIEELKLAYYVSTIPDGTAGGMWGDTFATWSDPTITWGAAHAEVAISVDPNRIFDNRRTLRMSRVAGAGEAGIKIVQKTNFTEGALARLCAVFYKPLTNDNSITLRLRRVSDGVYVHEETIAVPAVGYWYTHQGQFFEIPEDEDGDQVYSLEMTTTGDSEDELYVADCYSELAHIRYFMRLGGIGALLHDVTPLRYATTGYAQVSCTQPVNELSLQVAVLSPRAYAYGADVEPKYLK